MTVIETSESGANAFMALMESEAAYWVKCRGNPQGDQILVNEQIVAAAGRLIDAPVRPVALVEITDDFRGFQYGEVVRLGPGVAHGSLLLPDATVLDDLVYRSEDDNRSRQAGVVALWEWCLGLDQQWLYDTRNERSVWTFDHGLWFGGENDWTVDSLQSDADLPWPWDQSVSGLDASTFHAIADRLIAIQPGEICAALTAIPAEWGVSDEQLEAVAWMLYRRREPVADRLRMLAGHV